jgi:diguanylate cyclase (GGDEF)-like protein
MKKLLKQIDIFMIFNDDELSRLERYLTVQTFEKDAVVIAHDEIKKSLFIVLNGKIVSILKLPEGIKRNHGKYFTGDFFGVTSLFGNKAPVADYSAAEKSELLVIHEKEILELVENDSVIAIKFMSHLLNLTIRQLRESSNILADVVQWGENASRRVITDELTGIYNREFLEDALENFFDISKSNNKPLSLLMLDIDSYRQINEDLGREIGNKIILELVILIRSIISKHGIIARYGGDEFSILLPEADLVKATAIAEQIRKEVETYDFSKYLSTKHVTPTISIGISSFPETATDLITFRKKADASLYRAKEVGKNKVVCIE